MEIGNKAGAYVSGYYPLATPQNRQAISGIEQTRAQQERQREQVVIAEESESIENDKQQLYPEQGYDLLQPDSYHTFYSQDADFDQQTRLALAAYRQVATHTSDQHELMQRIDVLV